MSYMLDIAIDLGLEDILFFPFITPANPVVLFTVLEFSFNFSALGKNELWLM
jgi:hypothetical protein